jgi:hypothetical protein
VIHIWCGTRSNVSMSVDCAMYSLGTEVAFAHECPALGSFMP